MNVLVVEPGAKPYQQEIGEDLPALCKAIDADLIEVIYPFEDEVALICDEEGKLNAKPLNRSLKTEEGEVYDIIAGKFILTGLGEEDFASLPDDLMKKYTERFRYGERFVLHNSRIIVCPVPDGDHEDHVLETGSRSRQQERDPFRREDAR